MGGHRQYPLDLYNPRCPSRQVLDLLANKWTLLLIRLLSQRTYRYRELHRACGGVTQKVLTQTLRELERDGIVQRTVYPVIPPHVEYTLTPLGQTLNGLLDAVCDWVYTHFDEIEAARARYQPDLERIEGAPSRLEEAV
jgi:DNA-binding HxlR family transcriptional regulator